MLSQNDEFRKFAVKYKISRYYTSIITPIVFYALPASGKTWLLRQIVGTGLPTIDTDDIYFNVKPWFIEKNPALVKDVDFNHKHGDSIVKRCSEMLVGWHLFNTMMVGEVAFIVTNLHNSFLVNAARYGCTIIGYLPEYKTYMKQVDLRIKDMKVDKKQYEAWYSDVLKWKGTSYDKVNYWIQDPKDLLYLIYSKMFNGFSISKTLSRFHPGIFEGKTSGKTLRFAIASKVARDNKTLVALGANDIELSNYAEIGKRCLCYGNVKYLVEEPSIPNESIYPVLKDLIDIDKVILVVKTLSAMCCDIDTLITVGNISKKIKLDFLDIKVINIGSIKSYKDGLKGIKSALKTAMNKSAGCSILMLDRTSEYGLVEFTTGSGVYSTKIENDFKIINFCRANSKCIRIAYIPVIKEGFGKSLILDQKFKLFYLPYFSATIVRVAFLYDKWLPGLSTKNTYSLYDIEKNAIKFNNVKNKSNEMNETLYKVICKYLIRDCDVLNYNWDKSKLLVKDKYFFVGLFCLSNTTNEKDDVLKFISTMSSKVNCLFNLPNLNASYSMFEEDKIINGIMTTVHGERLYTDIAYDPNSFYKYENVQVFDTQTILSICQYYNVESKWHRIILPQSNSNSPKFKSWFFVGNILSEEDMKYQTIFNSQTEKMNSVARLFRICSGFDANVTYAIRVDILKEIIDTKDKVFAVSNSMTYYDKVKGEVVCVSGHAINMLIASKIFVIDLKRWLKTVKANLTMDEEYRNKVSKLRDIGLIAEPDAVLSYWHKPKDFIGVVSVANKVLSLYGLPVLESYFVDMFSEITKLPDINIITTSKLDISKA